MSKDRPQDRSTLNVVGATVAAELPVGIQHVRLDRGLNALYGRNGVGKTKLLTELGRQLKGRRATVDPELKFRRGDEHRPIPTPVAFYSTGGIHLRGQISGRENDPSSLLHLARTLVESEDWHPRDEPWEPFDRRNRDVDRDTPHHRRLGMTEEDVRHFLALGRWFVSPDLERIYLCDPNPLDSPLTDRWMAAAQQWETLFEKEGDQEPATMLGRLRWTIDDETAEFSWDFSNSRLRPWEVSIPLLPLPETLRLPAAPAWVAYPVLCVPHEVGWQAEVVTDGLEERKSAAGVIWGPVTDLTVRSLPHNLDRAAIKRREANKRAAIESGSNLRIFYTGPTPVHFDDALDEVVKRANLILADLFDDPPILRCRRRRLTAWMEGSAPIVWEANTAINGPWFPPAQLGGAHLRYSLFAIERAIQQWTKSQRPATTSSNAYVVDGGTFALIDEPERALHVAAERRLADAVTSLGDRVVVSSHSTEFLEATFNGTGTAHRLEKALDGSIQMSADHPSLNAKNRELMSELWGLTRARLATITGAILFVEGPHDELVLSHFLADELRRYRVVVLPLGGTKDLHLVAMTELVFSTSDAPVLVCVDNASYGGLTRCETGLLSRRGERARMAYLGDLGRDTEFVTPEMKQLLILMRAAVRHGRENRLHAFGLSARDIVEYLPVNLIDRRFNTWKELNKAFLDATGRRSFRPGDGRAKKEWVNSNGGSYNLPGIRRAMKEMSSGGSKSDRHRDFDALADRLRLLVTRQTAG